MDTLLETATGLEWSLVHVAPLSCPRGWRGDDDGIERSLAAVAALQTSCHRAALGLIANLFCNTGVPSWQRPGWLGDLQDNDNDEGCSELDASLGEKGWGCC